MKRLLQILELTKNEQRVVLIVVFVLITIAFVGYERRVSHFRFGRQLWQKQNRPQLLPE